MENKTYYLKIKQLLFLVIFGKKGKYGLRYRLFHRFRGTKPGEEYMYDKKIGIRGGINRDKKFVILNCGNDTANGLGSYISKFLSLLARWEKKESDRIPIIVFPEKSYYDFFEPSSSYSLKEIETSRNVIRGGTCYEEVKICTKEIRSLVRSDKYLKKYSVLFQRYFKFSPAIKSRFEEEYSNILEKVQARGEKVLGVKFRQADYICLKAAGHAIQPSVEEMADFVSEYMLKYGYSYCFLAVEEEQSRQYFLSKFGNKLLYCNNVLADYDVSLADKGYSMAEVAAEKKGKKKAEEDYLLDLLLLAKCDALLASDTSGTLIALILNDGRYERKNIIDFGYNKEDSEIFKGFLALRAVHGGHI